MLASAFDYWDCSCDNCGYTTIVFDSSQRPAEQFKALAFCPSCRSRSVTLTVMDEAYYEANPDAPRPKPGGRLYPLAREPH